MKTILKPKTLQQRMLAYILVPVFLILIIMGWISFIYAQNAILTQWGETAVSKLQKAAHTIDMRLSQPKNLLLMLKESANSAQQFPIQQFILERLKDLDGVVEVNYTSDKDRANGLKSYQQHKHFTGMMHFNQMGKAKLSLPQYNAKLDSETVSLSMDFIGDDNQKIGEIEVVISFQDLIDQINEKNWWKSNTAYLIDNEGNILSAAQSIKQNSQNIRTSLFGKETPLENKTLAALKNTSSGTIFGKGNPPKEISGFYHLNEAPWSLVIISPGDKVLKPILKFRLYYFGISFLFIIGIILFIRRSITPTANDIKKVSDAASSLANGIFVDALQVKSNDEVGELTNNFNKMTQQLKERIRMKKEMTLAMEVQQGLLPPASVSYKNLEISGRTVYCDQTGGDFFDIIEFPDEPDKVCVAVGDVVGHGIGAALLMTTTRALLRSRVTQKGSLGQIMNDVNKLLCLDTKDSARFVTLFLLVVDLKKCTIQWVRAGHEPAMVYHPENKKITELVGDGLALGFDKDWVYSETACPSLCDGTTILIGTDGIWDLQNNNEERFGKERVEAIIKENASLSPEKIIEAIVDGTASFRGETQQNDDITLLVLKFLQKEGKYA